ncbi:MAG: DUF1049 domain-containing protein [Deltaproteobacteria bacterium]|nr:DUF1049 domain-containing protein [Deltaproteobacteria bacterium]
MLKKTIYLIAIFLLVLFVVQNNVDVQVVFLNGQAHLKAIFLMLMCFSLGFLAGYYFVFRKEEELRVKIRQLKFQLAKGKERRRRRLEED